MKLYSLKCPHCGGNLEIEEDLETFFCKYCGAKIVMDRISKSQMRVREMEHDETLSEHQMQIEIEKFKAKRTEEKTEAITMIGLYIVVIILALGLFALVIFGKPS